MGWETTFAHREFCGRDGIIELMTAANERSKALATEGAVWEPLVFYRDFTSLQRSVDTLLSRGIEQFVNHTRTDAPMWTYESLYEYLGEEPLTWNLCRFHPTLWRDWMLQVYRVLNLLLWTRRQDGDTAAGGTSGAVGGATVAFRNRRIMAPSGLGVLQAYDDCVARLDAEGTTTHTYLYSIAPSSHSTFGSAFVGERGQFVRGAVDFAIPSYAMPRRTLPAGAVELKFYVRDENAADGTRVWWDCWPHGETSPGQTLYYRPEMSFSNGEWTHALELKTLPRKAVEAFLDRYGDGPFWNGFGAAFTLDLKTVTLKHEKFHYEYYDPPEVWRQTYGG